MYYHPQDCNHNGHFTCTNCQGDGSVPSHYPPALMLLLKARGCVCSQCRGTGQIDCRACAVGMQVPVGFDLSLSGEYVIEHHQVTVAVATVGGGVTNVTMAGGGGGGGGGGGNGCVLAWEEAP
jgi:hypothetical protein